MQKRQIIVIGHDADPKLHAAIERMKQDGADLVILTPDEAAQRGLSGELGGPEPIPYRAPVMFQMPEGPKRSGKENRRARRHQERRNKK